MSLKSALSRTVPCNRVPVPPSSATPHRARARARASPFASSDTDTANSRFKRDSREIEIDCSTWSVKAGSAARGRPETLDSVRVPRGRLQREESTGTNRNRQIDTGVSL